MPAGPTWAGQKWVEEELEGTFSATLGRRSTTRVQCHQISFSLHSSRIVSLRRIRPRLNSWRGLSSPPLPHSPTFRERLTYHLQERHSIKLCNIKGNELSRQGHSHVMDRRNGQENPTRSDRYIAVAKSGLFPPSQTIRRVARAKRRHKAEKRKSEGIEMCEPSVLTTDSFYFGDDDDSDDSHSTIRLGKKGSRRIMVWTLRCWGPRMFLLRRPCTSSHPRWITS
jgi:hypothetical protein